MKRTERHHLKEDQIAKGMNSVLDALKEHLGELIKAGVVLAALAVIVLGVVFVNGQRRSARSREISQVLSLAADLETKPGNAATLDGLAGRNGRSPLACIELAKYWMGKGETAKALGYLDRIPASRKDVLYYQGQMLKARIQVQVKNFDQAEAVLKKIIEDNPRDFPLDVAMFNLAEAYELQGNRDKAVETYKAVEAKYSQSNLGYEASQKAGRLASAGK